MDIGGALKVDRNVEGIVEVMLDATRKYDAPLTQERLFGWHAALFPTGRSGMRRITVGDGARRPAARCRSCRGLLGANGCIMKRLPRPAEKGNGSLPQMV
jgi:hypothetical protein